MPLAGIARRNGRSVMCRPREISNASGTRSVRPYAVAESSWL